MRHKAFAAVFATAVLLTGASQASTITEGFTFAVASDGGSTDAGTHFHSNTGGSFGNPAGKAEVGSYSSEEVRGLSEYNLTGLASSVTSFVTFNVFKLGGLFGGVNDFLFDGIISVDAYLGNNAEDISDYQATSLGTVGSFSTAGLSVGDVLSFDISSIFNTAIAGGASSLGIRLTRSGVGNSGAATFDTFRLTSDDQTTNPSTVPLPGGLPLAAAGLGALGLLGKRRKAEKAA